MAYDGATDDMTKTAVLSGSKSHLAASARPPKADAVPWLDGRLLRFLTAGIVLDIKAPGDPDGGPVVPYAVVTALLEHEGTGANPQGPFDAIFSRNGLAAAIDPIAALACWFDLLEPGGTLVAIVPQAPEAWLDDSVAPSLQSRPQAQAATAVLREAGPGRGFTIAALVRMIGSAISEGEYKIVLMDTAPVRRPPAEGHSDEIRVVLRKLAQRPQTTLLLAAAPDAAELTHSVADVSIPFTHIHPHPLKTPGMRCEGGLLVRDFAPQVAGVTRILVLKLDHHGDLIIALPALRELRQAFPTAAIRLVCGAWNVKSAHATGLFDDVREFSYFPERAAEWTGVSATTGWGLFAAAVEGRFDLAIDMRVDDDTRSLLGRVDARLRCGVGSQSRFPLLDIALPDIAREPALLALSPLGNFSTTTEGAQILAPSAFDSEMEVKTAAFHETGFSSAQRILVRSGRFFLPEGSYSAEFRLTTHRFLPSFRAAGVTIEVIGDHEREVASKTFGRRTIGELNGPLATLRFESSGKPSTYAFRVRTKGRPLAGRLRFAGLRLRRLDANGARYSPSELHVGEKLSLLVSLIRQRTQSLAPPAGAPSPRQPTGATRFVLAPFSNSSIRDWPVASYAELVGLLSGRYDCHIAIVGSPAQAGQAAELMRQLGDKAGRVANKVGTTNWAEVSAAIQSADMVICNNSGIAHQSAQLGARTLAIYSASHQPLEWGPRGPRSRAIMASVACSPCGYERIEDCAANHLCMRLITPAAVLSHIETLLAIVV